MEMTSPEQTVSTRDQDHICLERQTKKRAVKKQKIKAQ
jgi:hypothetical protein